MPPRTLRAWLRLEIGALVLLAAAGGMASAADDEIVRALADVEPQVLTADEQRAAFNQVSDHLERQRRQAIARENAAWREVGNRRQWEQFRDTRLEALRASLGSAEAEQGPLVVHTTGRHEGEGFVVENVVYQSRPGLWVTANLYRPARPSDSMPAILLSHSHHNPKTQGELQAMGITWARQGCVVLAPDHLGHGERRQHPFASDDDYPGSFRRGRQDYYFRYQVNLQLQAAGESLMGFLVHDLRRGIDLLEQIPGVDSKRLILIGAVAGGGDPAGVTAALDERIDAAIPFNFGGPQPDYQTPERAEEEFYFFGVPYWEQTRSLRLGARDGFAQWMIVASLAPRTLIYSHEFAWERERDPVWPRLEKVYSFYDAADHLATATGKGTLQGQAPESSHCNNVGAYHRRGIYPHLQRLHGMAIPAADASPAFDAAQLHCLTPEAAAMLELRPVHRLAEELARRQIAAVRQSLAALPPAERRRRLQTDWAKLLGAAPSEREPTVVRSETSDVGPLRVEHILLEVEQQMVTPLILLRPAANADGKTPLVVLFARRGKAELLERRREAIAQLVSGGAAVCLADLREMGETRSGADLSRGSRATTLSCRAQVLGQTLLGGRLHDLQALLRYLRSRGDLDGGIALWGESLAEANPAARSVAAPEGIGHENTVAEPEVALLALLAALFDEQIQAVAADGGYTSIGRLLQSPFLYLPHDAIVPGAPAAGDIADLAAALAPLPLRMHRPIDGVNRPVARQQAAADFVPAAEAYARLQAAENLVIEGHQTEQPTAAWLLEQLRR